MTYETIKKFLADGGKCLLIENGKPIGVVLTIEEYEKIQSQKSKLSEGEQVPYGAGKSQNENIKPEIPETKPNISSQNPIGDAMMREMSFPGASADPADINIVDAGDITLEDLGLDELPY